MTARPDMRIGDADREAAAASLREHFATGRLSIEEFNQRLDHVFAATTQGQLDQITSDLPHVRTPSVPLPVAAAGPIPGAGRRGRPRGPRSLLGIVGSLVAIVAVLAAIWVFTLMPGMMHLRLFGWGGRWSVLLAGLMIIRSLIRRVFGGRWAGGGGRGGRYTGHGHGHGGHWNGGQPW